MAYGLCYHHCSPDIPVRVEIPPQQIDHRPAIDSTWPVLIERPTNINNI